MTAHSREVCPNLVFGVALVDFHHTRGPEMEHWHSDELKECTWNNLPFQALPDGSHSFEETFTYFTLLYDDKDHRGLNCIDEVTDENLNACTTLFAISCARQIKSDQLLNKGDDVTRSIVQKSLVVISRVPIFGQIKDKLSIVTNALFLQRDFSDKTILHTLYQNLKSMFNSKSLLDESNLYVGLSLRKIIYTFRKDVLLILKAILLERKMIFYGSNVEELCSLQFGLISLIPHLISNLDDCGSPLLHKYESNLTACDSFKSSDRKSVLRFLGFPLQIFGKGGLFSPYTPLQQLDDLTSSKTKWYVIGTSNSLILEQKHKLADVMVNLDQKTVELVSTDKLLAQALQYTHHDRKWMDMIVNNVVGTWNENDLYTPSNFQFEGSEDFIRWQFEEYLTGLMSSVKLDKFISQNNGYYLIMKTIPPAYLSDNPIVYFNNQWVQLWKKTRNFKMFYYYTDDRLFDLFEPKHVHNVTDSMSAWQQKFIRSFKMLNRSDSRVNEGSHSEVNNCELKSPDSTSSTEERRCTEHIRQGSSGWNSWKEYFNTRLKRRSDDSPSISRKYGSSGTPTDGVVEDSLNELDLNSTKKSDISSDVKSLPSNIVENPWK
ncbi:HBR072Cp [Eremothecium sinecaudum]|uniref:HBR072Cp n=1 Tax=Eremothecium sinecaudum TaxID=45286 RepID=A0A109UWR4_9SACH|nr:HBR072Cp [Eremothecium sinecaudum]AMD18973.1 HBR072Cp [Eremothecium sinecaudum]